MPSLRDGRSSGEISSLFDQQLEKGRGYAYTLAEEIGKEIIATEADSTKAAVDNASQQPTVLDDYLTDDGPGELP